MLWCLLVLLLFPSLSSSPNRRIEVDVVARSLAQFFWRLRAWVDLGLMLLTFLLSLFVSVEVRPFPLPPLLLTNALISQVGIITSVCLSMLLCIKRAASIRINILARVPNTTLYEPLDEDEDEDPLLSTHHSEEVAGILVARIRDVALTFANTGALKERLRRLERYGAVRHHPADEPRREEASVVVFQLADVAEVDASALQIMLEVVQSYAARDVLVRSDFPSFRPSHLLFFLPCVLD